MSEALLGLSSIGIGIIAYVLFLERVLSRRQPVLAALAGTATPICILAGFVLVMAGVTG